MDRKQETKIVKKALRQAGFGKENEITVKHGTGTAYGWLDIGADIAHDPDCTCYLEPWGVRKTGPKCQTKWHEIHDTLIKVAQQATGRHGDWDGRIGIHLGFREP